MQAPAHANATFEPISSSLDSVILFQKPIAANAGDALVAVLFFFFELGPKAAADDGKKLQARKKHLAVKKNSWSLRKQKETFSAAKE